ncbi:ABC transporter permease [Salipiger abyssi]|uniref:ABC transporter permease n=1 Tax=Salipiger abyssi TaxID=1250539 RepID=UPI001A8C0098|nr:ABC transporter permease [Salipiger abyssi]MBN9889812.1 ABC transporter permease [Salipiger abyssi]
MSSQDFAPPARPNASPNRSFPGARAIGALILREMATSYGRSPGGYIWAILEPVAGIALLTIVFSGFLRSPGLGVSFPIFYATGMMPFMMYMGTQGKVASALKYSKPLLAYPTVTFVDAILGRFILDVMTKLLVSYIVFGGIMIAFETRTIPDYPLILEAFALAALLGAGIGTLNCFLFTRFPLFQQAWGILTRPLFILSCIFYLYDTVAEPFRSYLWYNPLIHIVGLMRKGFYPTYDATYVSRFYVLTISLVCLAVGMLLLRRFHTDLMHR